MRFNSPYRRRVIDAAGFCAGAIFRVQEARIVRRSQLRRKPPCHTTSFEAGISGIRWCSRAGVFCLAPLSCCRSSGGRSAPTKSLKPTGGDFSSFLLLRLSATGVPGAAASHKGEGHRASARHRQRLQQTETHLEDRLVNRREHFFSLTPKACMYEARTSYSQALEVRTAAYI